MELAEIILYGFFFLILCGIFILVYFFPEESLLLFNRWQYEEEPEFSEFRIRLNKYIALFGILFLILFSIGFFVNSVFVRMLLLLGLIIYVIIAILKLIPK